MARPQVRAPDHRPRSDPKVFQARCNERSDALLRLLAVFHPVTARVPEERGHVVLAIGEVGLRIDRDEQIAAAKDVVVVEVTVYEPIRARVELGKQITRKRTELPACELGIAKPARRLGCYRPKRRTPSAPQP